MSYKAGFIGLLGLPNAGKSTLVNYLIGEKVGIVTRKPQTTRQRVTGIYTDENLQALLVDSPGHIKAEAGINAFLQKELESVVENSDALLVVLNVDAKKKESLEEILEMAQESKKPFAIFINKLDLNKPHRLAILQDLTKSYDVPVLMGAAQLKNPGLKEELIQIFQNMLPDSPGPLYEDDIYTTQTSKQLTAEVIREKCFENLHQEIPYGLAVSVLKFDESQPLLNIHCEIVVSREGHRSMVVGQGGQTIKRIGQAARLDLEKQLGQRIYLNLFVKAKPAWMKNQSLMKELGYVIS